MPAFDNNRSFRAFGAAFSSEAARDLLQDHGLGEIESIFARGKSAHCRHAGRSVWDTRLTNSTGEPVRVYVKMNWGRRRLWPRMTDLKTGQWLWSHPVREWHGLGALSRLGLNVPERLAVFHAGLMSFRAAVVMRAIPLATSVQTLLESGDWRRLPENRRARILDRMLEVMQTIHAAGYGWRGTSVGHFYPRLDDADTENESRSMWLIDCEGVHPRASRRTYERDYRKLLRSFGQVGADRATLDLMRRKIEQIGISSMQRAA